jgi:hypothetical protein
MNGEGQAKVDHSKKAILHAQHIANFLVDEARLSSNAFEWTNDEQEMLLSNYDIRSVTLKNPHYGPEVLDFYRTELYLFE